MHMAGIRLIIYMLLALFKPIGRLVVGSLLILGGLVFGLASHAVTYHQAPTGEYTALTLEDGDVELRFQNGDTYYTITANAFVPALDHIPFPGKRIKSLTYIDEP